MDSYAYVSLCALPHRVFVVGVGSLGEEVLDGVRLARHCRVDQRRGAALRARIEKITNQAALSWLEDTTGSHHANSILPLGCCRPTQ